MPIRAKQIRWEDVIDLSHDAIFVRAADDVIIHWNRGAERLYGWTKEEALGRGPHDLLATEFPEPLADIKRRVEKDGHWEGFLRHKTKDGRALTIESRWTAIRDDNDEVQGYFEINRDVTAREQLIAERAARQQAEALSRELQTQQKEREVFLAVLGHDLRNPLGAIDLAASGLLRREDLPEPVLRAASRISSSAARMMRLIEQILDFARARYGHGVPLDKHRMNIHDVCRDVIGDAELRGSSSRIELHSEGDGDGIWDRDRLFQVVQNLVHNAIKFAAPNTPVRVSVRPVAPGVTELCVHNDGEPIPEEIMPVVFDPFRRGTSEATTTGLGLGLYIAQQVVLAHGGEITVESRAGHGTTFHVRLPDALHG